MVEASTANDRTVRMPATEAANELGRRGRVESPLRQTARRFLRHRLAMAGLVIVVAVGLLALFAPWVAAHDPNAIDLRARNSGPSADHWFGTDRTGRDTFARV